MRATTTSEIPAAFSASISAAPITVPFFRTKPPCRMRVHGGGAKRLRDRDRAEFHDAVSGWRSDAVICAMIDTAISDGDTAPMASPIGAWMRAICASVMPCAFRRSTRRPCVFFEPSAPM